MFVNKLGRCEEFTAGDDTILRELLHPDKENLDIRYSLAHATIKPGKQSYKHKLRTSEVYYILEGSGLMHIAEESMQVVAGDAVYIPPGEVQFIENNGNRELRFICIVDPAWRQKDEQVFKP